MKLINLIPLKEVEAKKTPGEKKEEKDDKAFAKTRLSGAEKIAETAKEKGGDAMLTYHHFNVKLSYYEKATEGKFDPAKAYEEYKSLVDQLVKAQNDAGIALSQIEFQKILGKIEVLGELLVEYGLNEKDEKKDKK
jgi:hypothetical protein